MLAPGSYTVTATVTIGKEGDEDGRVRCRDVHLQSDGHHRLL